MLMLPMTFVLQAFNTFIDDVFAFIITMPTSHRIAVFRDDVVFLGYLYQRWWVYKAKSPIGGRVCILLMWKNHAVRVTFDPKLEMSPSPKVVQLSTLYTVYGGGGGVMA